MDLTESNIIDFDKSDLKIRKAERDHIGFYSRFQFLMEHNSWRPGEIHLILGRKGGGKSTAMKSVLYDFFDTDKPLKVLILLSEESKYKVGGDLAESGIVGEGCLLENNTLRRKLILVSQMDQDDNQKKGARSWTEYCGDIIEKENVDIFIYDNLTTSPGYEELKTQVRLANEIKQLTVRMNIPTIIFAHTGTHVSLNYGRQIVSEDIFGSRQIIKIASIIHVLQQLQNESYISSTLYIEKSRDHTTNDKFFRLDFDSSKRIYESATSLPYKLYEEIFQKRNKL